MKRTYIQPEIETLLLAVSEMICGTNAYQNYIPSGDPIEEEQPGTADAKGVWMTDWE